MAARALVHSPKHAGGSWAERNAWTVPLVGLAVALCYANALRVPFLLDDPLPDVALEFRTRPLVWASFALNRLWSGAETWSYHLFNVLVHGLCGLLLLGVLRRGLALALPRWTPGARAELALVVTLLWLCHPLQTATVTYLSQRAEALASLGVLGTLYAFLHVAGSPATDGETAWRWQAFGVASLALGFLAKETAATAPLVLLLAEVALVPGALRANLTRRWRFHLLIALTAVALFLVYVRPLLFQSESSSGFGAERMGPLDYARTQPGVILHYLRLCAWPHPLVFDYGWPVAREPGDWLPQTVALGLLVLLALRLLARRAPLGFVACAFFVLLLPSSSVVPIKDLAFEHRMYLPLAAVLLCAALLVRGVCARFWPARTRLPASAAVLAVLASAALTVRRNHDYRSAVALWSSVVEDAPRHARAYNNLAAALLDEERVDEAERALARAQELAPPTSFVHRNLARVAAERGRLDEAIAQLLRALALQDSAAARSDLALLLRSTGRPSESEPHLRRALELAPARAGDRLELGRLLLARGEAAEALAQLERVVAERPGSAEARRLLAQAQAALGRSDEAEAELRRASELDAPARATQPDRPRQL